MTTNIRITITDVIINEYQTRDVFPGAWERNVEVSQMTAMEMLDDALFYVDKDGPDIPASLVRAYAAHAAKLRSSLPVPCPA